MNEDLCEIRKKVFYVKSDHQGNITTNPNVKPSHLTAMMKQRITYMRNLKKVLTRNPVGTTLS